MREYKNFIAGRFVSSTGARAIGVINPATEELISQVPETPVEQRPRQTISPSSTALCARTPCATSSARYGQLLNVWPLREKPLDGTSTPISTTRHSCQDVCGCGTHFRALTPMRDSVSPVRPMRSAC